MVFVLCVGGGAGPPPHSYEAFASLHSVYHSGGLCFCFLFVLFFSSTIEFQLYMFLKIKLPRRVFVYCVFYSSFFVRISIIVVIAVSI